MTIPTTMCSGAIIVLACGHNLIHKSAPDCNSSHRQITVLRDSCSGCYPPINIRNINQKYDGLREETMGKIRQATAERRFEDVDALRRTSRSNEVERMEQLGRWKRVKFPWSEVVWPGKKEE